MCATVITLMSVDFESLMSALGMQIISEMQLTCDYWGGASVCPKT